jgi:ferrous iron transport protein A
VVALTPSVSTDTDAQEICSRLHDIGFHAGERAGVLARVPGGDPMVVFIGQSRFALRRHEAQFVNVKLSTSESV